MPFPGRVASEPWLALPTLDEGGWLVGSCCSLTHRSAFACSSPVVPLSYPGSFFFLANLTKTSHRTSQCQFPNEPCPVVTTGFWSTSPLGWIHSSCYSARPLVTTARALPKVSSGCLGGADNSDSCTALRRCDASALFKSVLSCGSEPSVFSVPKHAPFHPFSIQSLKKQHFILMDAHSLTVPPHLSLT